MVGVMRCAVLAVAMLSMAQIASAGDGLYRCTDGTITNRGERQCPPYGSKGIVRVQGGTAEAPKQPDAEVKLFERQEKHQGAAR